jgi:hypothetical protein
MRLYDTNLLEAPVQAVTYRLITDHPRGILISDTFYMDNGKHGLVVLKKAGDIVDLNIVDAKTFANSSLHGQLNHHAFVSKQVTTAIQEVGEAVADRIRMALEAVQKPLLGATPTQVLEIEPGLQIAVAAQPQPPHDAPAEPVAAEVVAPAGQAVAPVSGDVATTETGTPAATAADSEAPSWKDNLDYATQKATITQSQDVAFLESLVNDPNETPQFKKLAAATLAALPK